MAQNAPNIPVNLTTESGALSERAASRGCRLPKRWASGITRRCAHGVTPMLRATYLLLLAFLSAPAFAGTPPPFAHWVPSGWKLIAHKAGDLNRDGIDDVVLVTEETNPANFKKNPEPLGPKILNFNPRRLIVLLNSPDGLKETLNRDNLLPSQNMENMACLADPLEAGGVSIERGNLIVKLQAWLSCGSYGVTNEKFTFRFDEARFRLIGYDYSEFSRSTGEQSEFSINYLTGKKKITKGLNAFEDSKPKVVWKKLPPKRAFFLDEVILYCDTVDPSQKDSWCQ